MGQIRGKIPCPKCKGQKVLPEEVAPDAPHPGMRVCMMPCKVCKGKGEIQSRLESDAYRKERLEEAVKGEEE
jgi:hypothetical protein